ncbi:hypothetical protein M404DRAFT_890530 [Pisolithus tinctorius Marx 270]|uniref:Uncharacterized protein n=1 Tax=Pisolithus tinctorius Marx 270 TaxID=870435 RepID=A0A0C3IKN8_PISTI|nr:hypothetical protein M404DRAFT_890530 [Pisolithus tinctorius Marx 270]
MLSPESGGSASVHELTSLGASTPEIELSDVERRPRSDGIQPAAHDLYPPAQTRPQRMRRSNPLLRNLRLFMSTVPLQLLKMVVKQT